MRCSRSRSIVVTLLAAAVLVPAVVGQTTEPVANLEIAAYLPRAPLVAWAANAGNGADQFDALLATVRRFLPAEEAAKVDEAIAKANEKLGIDLRGDLLARLGPQAAVAVDLPPIDSAAAAVMSGAPDAISSVLGKIGIWIQVREARQADAALRTALTSLGLQLSEDAGVVKAMPPAKDQPGGGEAGRQPEIALFYRIANGVLTVGFDGAAVRAGTKPSSPEGRLTAGADFQKVFSHLDSAPTSFAYVNIPHLQEMLRSSEMLKGILSSKPEAAQAQSVLLDPSNATSGFGLTKTLTGDGVRQVTFGPKWMAGGTATAGMIAAIAIPNLVQAIERGRQKRTMADLRSLSAAIEAYSVDENRYPQPHGKWLEAGALAGDLVPTYIRELPTTDGWDHPVLYWSDGEHYRLVSPGKDGATSRDWSTLPAPEESEADTDDIVMSDGELVQGQ